MATVRWEDVNERDIVCLLMYRYAEIFGFGAEIPYPPNYERVIDDYILKDKDGKPLARFLRTGEPWELLHINLDGSVH